MTAVVIGAGGGIGAALTAALRDEGMTVTALARRFPGADAVDITDEASIAAAAARVASGPAPTLVIVATGLLHDNMHGPERSLRELDPDWLLRSFHVNAIGPALIAKHFLPLMPRDQRTVFAALSARVGSISDNRLGGWHSYRAAKAALNQLIRTLAIEEKRRNPQSIIVALHPGTVDTPLSQPFQGSLRPGQLFAPDRAAVQLLDLLDGLKSGDSGRLFGWDGQEIAP